MKATAAAEEDPYTELRRALGHNPSSDELFDHIDKDMDGTIDRREFQLAHAYTQQQAAKAARAGSWLKLLLWFFGIMFLLDAGLTGVIFVMTTVAIETTKEYACHAHLSLGPWPPSARCPGRAAPSSTPSPS